MRSLVALGLLLSVLVASPARADGELLNLAPPQVTGVPAYLGTVSVSGDLWATPTTAKTFQWFADGVALDGATASTYSPGLGDIGRRLTVLVAVSDGLTTGSALSAPSSPVVPAAFVSTRRPKAKGVARFERTLVARRGRSAPAPDEVRFQWLRDDEPIAGATKRRYRLGVEDVGARVSVRTTVRRAGFEPLATESKRRKVRHRVDVHHTVTYSVATRGHIVADLAEFARQAQETFDDPRGWRGSGVRFVRVAQGGSFTLYLSQASLVPSFGFPCDSYYSCRVGNAVIVNQDRWLGTTPVWRASKRGVRDYRHLVVNHEVGHWLGRRHSTCGGPGQPAPVMMQQSKGLHGCYANPWPVAGERGTPRF